MRFTGARWIAVALVLVLGLVVAVLSALALQQSQGDAVAQPNPIPSFSLGVQTQTPTSSAEPPAAPVTIPPGQERFFSVGAEAWWRGTAGRCGETEPLLERSVDGGQSWEDVTPRYLGIGELMSLDAFAPTEAEMVVKIGPACEVQALRTFTQGRFWEPYPDVLAVSRYIDSADSGTIDLGAESILAPCESASGLRASGDLVAVLCEGLPSVGDDSGWRGLAATEAIAVAFDDQDVLVAHRGPNCEGLTVTRFPAESPDAPALAGCVPAADPASPAALAIADGVLLVWTANQVLVAS